MRRAAALLLMALLPAHATAHALDEYVQGALVSVEQDHVSLSLRLVPGKDVLDQLLPLLDGNGDGAISAAEGRAYARQLMASLELTLDGNPLTLRPGTVETSKLSQMREGFGAIRINLEARAASRPGEHRLVLENRHLPRISAYLANGLKPRDPRIVIKAQRRNPDQSHFEMDYVVIR
jgi:hypothetical protein